MALCSTLAEIYFHFLLTKLFPYEKYIFLIAASINLLPVFAGEFFPTMDGAAHLYNANLLGEFIFGNTDTLDSFFKMNTEPVPNWTGHILLMIFGFLPAWLAEKILLVCYVLGLPYAFRFMVKSFNPLHVAGSYLIIPFVSSFLFFLGFYNFSIALIFFFVGIGWWMINKDQLFSSKKILQLFLLLLLTYFSHIFVFAMLLAMIGLHWLFWFITDAFNSDEHIVKNFIDKLKSGLAVLLAAIVPLSFFIYYFASRNSGTSTPNFLSREQLIEDLFKIRSNVALNMEKESAWNEKMIWVLSALLIFSCGFFVVRLISKRNPEDMKNKPSFYTTPFFFAALLFFALLYFVLPDSDMQAGFVSVRLCFFIFLMLVAWISAMRMPAWVYAPLIFILLAVNFKKQVFYADAIRDLNRVAMSCYELGEKVKPGSVILPFNYSDNWLTGHFSNYLGAENNVVILENYECGTGYFPLLWNREKMPDTMFGDVSQSTNPCTGWMSEPDHEEKSIDYVFMLGKPKLESDSCHRAMGNILLAHYHKIAENDFASLYELKK